MAEPRMIICDNCRREWNMAALAKCPGCGAGATGAIPSPEAAATPPYPSATPAQAARSRTNHAVNAHLVDLARKVDSLASIVVAFAWILGILGVGSGVILVITGANTRTNGSSVVAAGIVIAVQGLVAAVFIALVGRYAQMRAAQAQIDS